MRTLYFDCFAGISGDMTLGALVAAGVDASALIEELKSLGVEGYEISFDNTDRSGIRAVRANVQIEYEDKKHRHLSDVLKIINASKLSEGVKKRAARIFERLGEAEARVHGVPIERVHFHEVGAIDSIVDIVGVCIGFEMLGVERFICSPLHVGSGTVEMEHGRFPVPPPAVAELLKEAKIYSTEIKGELVTPTGAAIVSEICESFGPLPTMRIEATGYGAGTRVYEKFPNVLRVILGETEVENDSDEKLLLIETNVDDASPELIGHLLERAFVEGALDCFLTPVQMKKNRPGVLVSILCRTHEREKFLSLLFQETTTIGARFYEVGRRALLRDTFRVETEFGAIDVKAARIKERMVGAKPEYEQCRAAAEKFDVPLRAIEEAALAAFNERFKL